MNKRAKVRSTFANVRSEPDQRSELYSQLILGDTIEIIGTEGNFFKAQLFDGSEGWIHKGYLSLQSGNKISTDQAKKMVTDRLYCHVRQEPNANSNKIKLLLDGTTLECKSLVNDYYNVLLPGEQEGWISINHVIFPPSPEDLTGAAISQRAKRYFGIPYLWGGTTPLAFDCSGLVQYAYRVAGKVLPRNSSQQAQMGILIESDKNWGNLAEGDLLFFAEGKNVDHVAISLGGPELIHASLGNGEIRIESLDENAGNYSDRLSGIYHSTRRIIPS